MSDFAEAGSPGSSLRGARLSVSAALWRRPWLKVAALLALPLLAFAVVYLGSLIADEEIRGRSLVAGAVVLAAVALTVSAGGVARDDARSDAGQERRAEDEAEVPL